jgi:hypothetical protein
LTKPPVASFAGLPGFFLQTPGSASPSPGAITLSASFAGWLDAFIQLTFNHTRPELCQKNKKLSVCFADVFTSFLLPTLCHLQNEFRQHTLCRCNHLSRDPSIDRDLSWSQAMMGHSTRITLLAGRLVFTRSGSELML